MVFRFLCLTFLLAACAPKTESVVPESRFGEISLKENEINPEEFNHQWQYPDDYSVNPLDRDGLLSGRALAGKDGSVAGPWLEGKEAAELPVGIPNVAIGKAILEQLGPQLPQQILMQLQSSPEEKIFAYYLRIKDLAQRAALTFNGQAMTQDNIWNLVFYIYTLSLPPLTEAVDASLRPGEKQNGAQLFAANCAMCHGAQGDSRGHSGKYLPIPPANFTQSSRMFNRSFEQLVTAVKNGIYGTAMPLWKDKLSENEIRHIVAYVLSFSYINEPQTGANR